MNRMNEKIMKWPSVELYEDKLRADESVKNHTLCELSGITQNEDTGTVLLLIDTAGCDFHEISESEGVSEIH
jgi:DNA polymerase alpha-associated DNA helicase A